MRQYDCQGGGANGGCTSGFAQAKHPPACDWTNPPLNCELTNIYRTLATTGRHCFGCRRFGCLPSSVVVFTACCVADKLNTSHPGAKAYYASLVELWDSWNVRPVA